MINHSKVPSNRAITSTIMKSNENGYFSSIREVEAILSVSKEPRIFALRELFLPIYPMNHIRMPRKELVKNIVKRNHGKQTK